MKLIKRLFCDHDYVWDRNIHGGEIPIAGYKRSWWKCSKCGKMQLRDELYKGPGSEFYHLHKAKHFRYDPDEAERLRGEIRDLKREIDACFSYGDAMTPWVLSEKIADRQRQLHEMGAVV